MSNNDRPSAADPAAIYDQALALESAGGDAALAADLMSALLDGLPEEIESLKACLTELDWPGLAEYAHQLRSATGYCGVPSLDAAISALERAARIEDAQRCQDCFDDVLHQSRDLLDQRRELTGGAESSPQPGC
ncbi:Hpt domain-containing protein [Thiorhodococcus mannitoliphagus]|uniref:Hpt domain-containing protein n=1 Tax=Thiorhodococcus mannitoliphagus TaxID=329406 RepID=A0A6P1DVR9_9GAMM|nr:Hpt domain-containing protein [Thiorhodococcus mannitoliphagus]NEX22228.1 Hpt domain-containing protein [Thiorhodococcus mannitoliphagus]